MAASDWDELCVDKRRRLADLIPRDWRISGVPITDQPDVVNIFSTSTLLSPREIEITETADVDRILKNLASAAWSSVEVVTAFSKRAVITHQLTNCLTEIFVQEALERAKQLDNILAETGKVVGPLHGLPVSLKDQFKIKGLETVMGNVCNIGTYAQEDSVLVQALYKCGAVPFVRTNIPQTLMWVETFNNVFGRTTNPYNRNLTPGGSSGGEGALIAMKGSPLGVGTDIGGSIRVPSSFCGLYGLRPSYNRFPYYGASNSLVGQESILSVLGPMSNTLSGIKTFTQSVLSTRPWTLDPAVIRKPWSEEEWNLSEHGGVGARLCFGILWDVGLAPSHPPIRRALKIVQNALEKAGHQVVDWEPHRHDEIFRNVEAIYAADGGIGHLSECAKSGEPFIRTMKPSQDEQNKEGYKYVPANSCDRLIPEVPTSITAYELWALNDEKRDLRKSYLDHWERTVSRTSTGRPVDAIISPVLSFTATPHGMNFTSGICSIMWNGLDYSSIAFPVTHVDLAQEEPFGEDHKFLNSEDEEVYRLYQQGAFDGCPVGLQLVGRTLEEEAVLRMAYIIKDALTQL